MPPQRLDRQPPPRYATAVRMYNNSLASVVITLSLIVGIWTLIWAIDMFQEMNIDKDHGQPKLQLFALLIGILYISTTGICLWGIAAGALQREKLVKSFALGSIIGAVCVVGGGFLRVIVHFIHKNDLITECEDIVTGTGVTFRFGIWGPRIHDNLTPSQAAEFCKDGWSHDSASEIISLIAEIVLAALFVFVSFGFVKQVKQSKKERKTAMASAHDFEDSEASAGYPSHYNPPYLGYDAPAYNPTYSAPAYAPPPGPPPTHGSRGLEGDDGAKADNPFEDFEDVNKKDAI